MTRTTLLFCLLFAGCGSRSNEVASSTGEGSTEKPRVALIMKSLANDFFSVMAEGAEQHHKDHANEYELIVNGIENESDLGRQVALVEEMVAANVDAIVIAPADSKALVPALRRAMKSGVVVVNIDNRLDVDVLREEEVAIPFVGPDNRAGAKKVGEYLASVLTKGDEVAILEGKTTAFNGIQRRLGFEDAMLESGLKVVSSQSADWETDKANTITASILSEHPNLKGILASNDSMAVGAVAAVKAAGRTGDVLIVGFDNIAAVQQLLEEEKVVATADQHGDELAVFGIETALALLDDPEKIPEDVETPVDLIITE